MRIQATRGEFLVGLGDETSSSVMISDTPTLYYFNTRIQFYGHI